MIANLDFICSCDFFNIIFNIVLNFSICTKVRQNFLWLLAGFCLNNRARRNRLQIRAYELDYVMGFWLVFGTCSFLFTKIRYSIHSENIHTHICPKSNCIKHVIKNFRVFPVNIQLERIECVVDVIIFSFYSHFSIVIISDFRKYQASSCYCAVFFLVFNHISKLFIFVLAVFWHIFSCNKVVELVDIPFKRLLKPFMLVGKMVENKISFNFNPLLSSSCHKLAELFHAAKVSAYVFGVSYIKTRIAHGRICKRQNINRCNP
ncbi:unknown [Clostridium sp. CAG:306]|nr:unknown [Clostridium sp. CAG:306]